MSNKVRNIGITCGILAAFTTILFYLLTFHSLWTIPIRWVSLVFLLVAEIAGTVKAYFFRRSIYGVANLTTSLLHMGFVIASSVVFVRILPMLWVRYILLNVLALCVLTVADIGLLYGGDHVEQANRKLDEAKKGMHLIREKAEAMRLEYADTEYGKELADVVEALRYSDDTVLTKDELEILQRLDDVDRMIERGEAGVHEAIHRIRNGIDVRSVKVAGTKRGSY